MLSADEYKNIASFILERIRRILQAPTLNMIITPDTINPDDQPCDIVDVAEVEIIESPSKNET